MRTYTQTEVDLLNQMIDRLEAEKARLVEVCRALEDRLTCNNGHLPLGPRQQRGWRDKIRFALTNANVNPKPEEQQ